MNLLNILKGVVIGMAAMFVIVVSPLYMPYYTRPNETHFRLAWESFEEIPAVTRPMEGMYALELVKGEKGRMHADYWSMAAEIPLFYTKNTPDISWGVYKCPDKSEHYHAVRLFAFEFFPVMFANMDDAKTLAHIDFYRLVYIGYGGKAGVSIEPPPAQVAMRKATLLQVVPDEERPTCPCGCGIPLGKCGCPDDIKRI